MRIAPALSPLAAFLLALSPATFQAAEPEPAAPAAAENGQLDAVANSVVKVFCTVRYPDLYRPWTKQAPAEATGSGVVIEGKRILTSAHVVAYASQVQVQANQAGDKLSATVEMVAPGIDLAVLKLDDESFFATHPPLPRANTLPEIKETVMAYGYPTGGTSLSITKGIVSRIEFAPYTTLVAGLRIQIDAAINPGNSGGPAVVGGKMIGLAFSHLGGAENIGYIVPSEEIELFLADVADGRYDGKPVAIDEYQTFQNEALRAFLKVDKAVEGLVVHRVMSADPQYPLQPWDVITRIGDTPVDNEGMVKLGPSLRISFAYLFQKLVHDGKVPLTILRAGKTMAIELPVIARPPLVMNELAGEYPAYFIYGPLVFTTATIDFVGGIARGQGGLQWLMALTSTGSPLIRRVGDRPAFAAESLVVVSSPFFPHKLAKGYANPSARVLKSVNGLDIKNLAHLVEVLRDARDEFIRIEFEGRADETLVFRRAETLAATEEILTDNGVRSQATPELLTIWNAKPSR